MKQPIISPAASALAAEILKRRLAQGKPISIPSLGIVIKPEPPRT